MYVVLVLDCFWWDTLLVYVMMFPARSVVHVVGVDDGRRREVVERRARRGGGSTMGHLRERECVFFSKTQTSPLNSLLAH